MKKIGANEMKDLSEVDEKILSIIKTCRQVVRLYEQRKEKYDKVISINNLLSDHVPNTTSKIVIDDTYTLESCDTTKVLGDILGSEVENLHQVDKLIADVIINRLELAHKLI